MAERRPLVIISGQIQELPAGDTLPGGGSTFLDNVFRVQDDGDNTKQLAFQVSGVTTGTTRTATVPNRDFTLDQINEGITTIVNADSGGLLFNNGGVLATDPNLYYASGQLRVAGTGTYQLYVESNTVSNDGVFFWMKNRGTNATHYPIRIRVDHITNPAANFGAGIWFDGDNGSSGNAVFGQLAINWIDPTASSEHSKFEFTVNTAGTLTKAFEIRGSQIRIGTTTNYIGLAVSSPTSYTITLPSSAPGANTYLKYNGSAYVWDTAGGASGLTVGTTTITSGASGRFLYDNAGVLGESSLLTQGAGIVVTNSTANNALDVTSTNNSGLALSVTQEGPSTGAPVTAQALAATKTGTAPASGFGLTVQYGLENASQIGPVLAGAYNIAWNGTPTNGAENSWFYWEALSAGSAVVCLTAMPGAIRIGTQAAYVGLAVSAPTSYTITFPSAAPTGKKRFGYSGSAYEWDSIEDKSSFEIKDPVAADELTLFYTEHAITIQELDYVIGAATSVNVTIRHSTDRSATGNSVTAAATTVTSLTTGTIVNSFSDATVPAASWVWVEIGTVVGTPGFIAGTIRYTRD